MLSGFTDATWFAAARETAAYEERLRTIGSHPDSHVSPPPAA